MMSRMDRRETDRRSADFDAIDASFDLLADEAIELDRSDGARGAHLKQIVQPFDL
jgi:hypothetical protein